MSTKFQAALGLTAALALSAPVALEAQSYPTGTIRIITTDVGGSNDSISRMLAAGLSERLGETVIVDNRSSGVIPNEAVKNADPDGHTLLVTGSSMWVGTLFRDMPYDPLTDFTPITLISQDANVLVVHPSMPVDSVEELVDYIRERPGELNYAATSIGGSMHLAGEMFKSLGELDVVRINYSGGSMARTDLMAGNVEMGIVGADSAMPLVEGGKLKALGVTTLNETELVPGLPPISATLPGYEVVAFTAILAPPGTPDDIVATLSEAINAVLADPETKRVMTGLNHEIIGGPPEVLANRISTDMERWGRLVEAADLRAE